MLARSSLTFVVIICVTGCASSNYQPANSPRLSQVLDGGSKKYRKNGKTYDTLVEAVADDPRALEEARAARSLDQLGGGFVLGGFALDIAGASMLIAGEDKPVQIAGFSLISAAAVALAVGIVVGGHSVSHRIDAINIYNDDVEAKMFLRRPAPAPAGTPAPGAR
jgi:hypothetical protein